MAGFDVISVYHDLLYQPAIYPLLLIADATERVRIPEGRHFCLYALQSVLPLIPAKQRRLAAEDWLEQDSLVACPDPDERVIMRIERIGERTLVTEDLT